MTARQVRPDDTSGLTDVSTADAAPQPVCAHPDPLAIIAEEHALQRELCDLLEAIADGLPAVIDRALAQVSVSILESTVPRHMRLEEDALFPLLRLRIAPDHALHSALACLEDEHDRDGATLLEVTDALRSVIEQGRAANPDMLGYLLRGFFESQRRHIAWEDQVVLPAARALLTPMDLAELQSWVMRSEHPRCSHQSLLAIRKARSGAELCAGCTGNRQGS